MKKYLNIVCAIIYMLTCTNCKKIPVKLEGVLLNENKRPILNGKIHFVLWKQSINSEEIKSDFFTTTDSSGNFSVDLYDVNHLDFVIESEGFYPYVEKGYVPKGNNKIEISLSKAEGSFLALTSFDDEKKKLRIGVEREFSDSNTKNVTIKDTISGSNIAVWLELEDNNFEKLSICTTFGYGILPIYDKDIKGSIYWELIYAPTNGYKIKHKISGNELGYFIKAEKGYAKLVLNNNSLSGTRPINDGYIKFKHYSFDWIYNTTNNDLSVSNTLSDKMIE